LGKSFYHLDGIGQLPHLEKILSITELSGVQWVPGAGQPDLDQWPEVYKRIKNSGKKIQLMRAQFNILDNVVKQIGTTKGVHCRLTRIKPVHRKQTLEGLARYGVA
jgi:5-methyltetrahydrofolate--homocysteine methyltransferase